jgi:hypothetical protein
VALETWFDASRTMLADLLHAEAVGGCAALGFGVAALVKATRGSENDEWWVGLIAVLLLAVAPPLLARSSDRNSLATAFAVGAVTQAGFDSAGLPWWLPPVLGFGAFAAALRIRRSVDAQRGLVGGD